MTDTDDIHLAADSPFADAGRVGADLAAVDWGATSLGPPESWPQSLRTVVRVMLASRFSMWMAWGPDLTFFCNDAYRRDTLGAKYPWALGRPFRAVWAEIWEEIEPRITAVTRDGVSTWDESLMLFLERDGYAEETYHTFSYSPLRDEAGGIAGLICVVSEDTERVVGEDRMTTLRELGAALAGAGDEASVTAAAGRVLRGNPRVLPFTLTYLYAPDGAARLACSTGFATGDALAPELPQPDAPWPLNRAATGETTVIPAPAGHALPTGAWDTPPLQVLVAPLLQPGQDSPLGALVVGLNPHRPLDEGYRAFVGLLAAQLAAAISGARTFEAERRRAEELAELDRAKSTFFTNVSHELRTPLTLLLGPAEDALADVDEPLGPEQRRRMELVDRNAQRLLKLVNTLLEFSRLESGRSAARFEPTDLARYTAELVSMFDSAVQRAGLTLAVQAPPLPEPVFVDREMWAKIVLNLLSNALKFTFEGGLTVSVAHVDGVVEVRVSDTGIGIDPGAQATLFERFQRVTGARSRSHEGSGIGLALVAELAAEHGGTATVESTPGAGSSFTVRVPFGRAHLPPGRVTATAEALLPPPAADGFVAEALRWLEPTGAPRPRDGDGRPRVLFADDNADMRSYVSELLGDEYAVELAADGQIALERARAEPPDLVLTDVMMPNLDGFGLLAALHADPATMHVPVVMLSARAGEEGTAEGLEAGADDYLVKPFTARELLARVRANLELDRVRRTRDALERSRVLLDQAQRLAQLGSWEIDLLTDTITASGEFLRIVGLDLDELASLPWTEVVHRLVHPADVARVMTAIEHASGSGAPLAYEARLQDRDGQERWIRVRAVVVDGADGPVALQGSMQDITEQRAAEQALSTAAAAREVAAREHTIAEELQRSLLPPRRFTDEGLEVAAYYQAGVEGTHVGGDWYDVIALGDGRVALSLGDVMGRGIRAAAIMGQLRAAIRAYAQLDLAPDAILRQLDATVRDLGDDQIATCVYGVYDPAAGELAFANAGHLPPLLAPPGRPARRLTGGSGPPLGIGPIDAEPQVVAVAPGDLIALYTDGLVERRGTSIDARIDRVAARLARPPLLLDAFPSALVEELLPEGPEDDIAILLARVPAGAAPVRASLEIAADPRAVGHARAFVGATLGDWGASPTLTGSATLLASELVTNAIRHGGPPIELTLRLADDHAVLEVLDGDPQPPSRGRPSAEDESGRGLLLVDALAAQWGTHPTPAGKSVWCVLPFDG